MKRNGTEGNPKIQAITAADWIPKLKTECIGSDWLKPTQMEVVKVGVE